MIGNIAVILSLLLHIEDLGKSHTTFEWLLKEQMAEKHAFAFLNSQQIQFVCDGRHNGACNKVADGSRAQHRCAMGMCANQCVLEPVNEFECENCIRTLCPRAR